MTMTRRQIVEHSNAYVDWWIRRGMNMVACLTIDAKKWRPKHHSQVVKAVKTAFSKFDYAGPLDGVVERSAEGTWHAHVVFQDGLIDAEALRTHWFFKHGKAMVRKTGSRRCSDCVDRPECTWRPYSETEAGSPSWQKPSLRGCGDLEYVGRKMHQDRRDGGAIIC